MSPKGWAVPLIAAGVVLSGCSSAGSVATGPTGQQDVSWVKSYPTITALTDDATVVVRGTIQGSAQLVPADEAGVTTARALLYTVDVTRVIKGALPQDRITIRGMPDASVDGGSADAAQLQPGGDYLLFLTPFEWHAGVPTGAYVMVGQEGAYRISAATATLVAAHDPLPSALPLPTLEGQVTAAA